MDPCGRVGTRALNMGTRRLALPQSSPESAGRPSWGWAWKTTIPRPRSTASTIAGIMAVPFQAAPWPASGGYADSGSWKSWRRRSTSRAPSRAWLTRPIATYSWRPRRNTTSLSASPTPRGTRGSISLILGEALAGRGDEPHDALALRPRNVEGELHPGFASHHLRRRAPRLATVRQELARMDIRERLWLVGIEDEEHGRRLRPTPGWHLDPAQANEGPRPLARGPHPVPVDGDEVADRLRDRVGLHRLAHGAGGQRDEVVAVLDGDEVVETDVAAGGFPVLEPGEVVRERRASPLADRATSDGGGVELDVLVLAVHLDHDVDDLVLGLESRALRVCFHQVPPGAGLHAVGPWPLSLDARAGVPARHRRIVSAVPSGSGIGRCGVSAAERRGGVRSGTTLPPRTGGRGAPPGGTAGGDPRPFHPPRCQARGFFRKAGP